MKAKTIGDRLSGTQHFKLKRFNEIQISTARNYLIKGLLPRSGRAVDLKPFFALFSVCPPASASASISDGLSRYSSCAASSSPCWSTAARTSGRGPMARSCLVRAEFYKQCLAEGDTKQQTNGTRPFDGTVHAVSSSFTNHTSWTLSTSRVAIRFLA
jgi:hypothetical protein